MKSGLIKILEAARMKPRVPSTPLPTTTRFNFS